LTAFLRARQYGLHGQTGYAAPWRATMVGRLPLAGAHRPAQERHGHRDAHRLRGVPGLVRRAHDSGLPRAGSGRRSRRCGPTVRRLRVVGAGRRRGRGRRARGDAR